MIHHGDVRKVLPTLKAGSVQCVVTSPPYWNLRDYQTGQWEGGDADCDHLHKTGGTRSSTLGLASGGHDLSDEARLRSTTRSFVSFQGTCGKCGATRIDKQLGLEPTPEAYVENMVAVFREVKRVLRDDGTVWLNLGDSFQDKQLVGMPWRVAFALQADGWYLRSDIVWAKGASFCPDYNGSIMPESVTDRPTKSHEYLFLLTKSAKYYYDTEAVREPAKDWGLRDRTHWRAKINSPSGSNTGNTNLNYAESGRNLRSVWTINPQPYAEAHFATFPEKLVEPCVKAGTKHGDTVLDPFAGSGTTGLVAGKLGREFVGIELNADYITLAQNRIEGPLFATLHDSAD